MGQVKSILIVVVCALALGGCLPSTKQGPALNSEPVAPSAMRMEDLDCAAAYQTLVSVRPSLAPLASPRADGAIRAYRANPPPATSGPTPVTDGEILAEVEARTGPRVQRIASRQENLPALVADVHTCDAQYGHEPIRLQ